MASTVIQVCCCLLCRVVDRDPKTGGKQTRPVGILQGPSSKTSVLSQQGPRKHHHGLSNSSKLSVSCVLSIRHLVHHRRLSNSSKPLVSCVLSIQHLVTNTQPLHSSHGKCGCRLAGSHAFRCTAGHTVIHQILWECSHEHLQHDQVFGRSKCVLPFHWSGKAFCAHCCLQGDLVFEKPK